MLYVCELTTPPRTCFDNNAIATLLHPSGMKSSADFSHLPSDVFIQIPGPEVLGLTSEDANDAFVEPRVKINTELHHRQLAVNDPARS